MSETLPFTCPFCGRDSTIDYNDLDVSSKILSIDNADELGVFTTTMTVCPNPKCKKVSCGVQLYKRKQDRFGNSIKSAKFKEWQLIPSSRAKALPEYIPTAIRSDYEESCSIINLSPKAAATLARRCIQGMIRDFWSVKKPDGHKGPWRLVEEIKAIKDKVDPDVWSAIEAVRSVGNIGAHMEEDINMIVDIEPNEAQKLVVLIEMLIDEWYINRDKRKKRLTEVTEIGDLKKNIKS